MSTKTQITSVSEMRPLFSLAFVTLREIKSVRFRYKNKASPQIHIYHFHTYIKIYVFIMRPQFSSLKHV